MAVTAAGGQTLSRQVGLKDADGVGHQKCEGLLVHSSGNALTLGVS